MPIGPLTNVVSGPIRTLCHDRPVNEPVIVVGNGVSGYACAARLAENGVDVTMIGPGLPHDRPPLSKRAIATGKIPYLADQDKMAAAGLRHIDGTVTATDLGRRVLTVLPSNGADPLQIDAPHLVWATGFVYPFPPVPGIPAIAQQNATADGLIALRHRLTEPGRRVIVVGAGLIGTETAATLAVTGHQVTLVDMLDRPLARLQPVAAEAARSTIAELGVTFLGECRIDRAHVVGTDVIVETSTHGRLIGDVLVTAAGFRTSLPADLALDGEEIPADAATNIAIGVPFRDAKRITVESFERAYLMRALREHGGNVSRTAEAIGMVRQSLQQKIRELDLRSEDWSDESE